MLFGSDVHRHTNVADLIGRAFWVRTGLVAVKTHTSVDRGLTHGGLAVLEPDGDAGAHWLDRMVRMERPVFVIVDPPVKPRGRYGKPFNFDVSVYQAVEIIRRVRRASVTAGDAVSAHRDEPYNEALYGGVRDPTGAVSVLATVRLMTDGVVALFGETLKMWRPTLSVIRLFVLAGLARSGRPSDGGTEMANVVFRVEQDRQPDSCDGADTQPFLTDVAEPLSPRQRTSQECRTPSARELERHVERSRWCLGRPDPCGPSHWKDCEHRSPAQAIVDRYPGASTCIVLQGRRHMLRTPYARCADGSVPPSPKSISGSSIGMSRTGALGQFPCSRACC